MSRLFLKALSLSHFRSHRATRLALDHRPVAIFGANGAGKTNILEAISLLSPGRGLRRAAAGEMARRPEEVGWKVTAALDSLGQHHEIETWAEPGQARQLRIDGKTAPQAELGRIARILWLTPAMDRLWTEGAEGRRRFLDRIALSLFPEHGDIALRYERAMRERNRLLRDGVRDGRWYEALEAQMASAGAALLAGRRAAIARLAAVQPRAEGPFPAATLSLETPEGEALPDSERALAAAIARSRPRDMAAGRSLIGPHRQDLVAVYAAKAVPARDCSTGEQKALLISLILANARAIAEDFGAPPILLLDEVAAHLDAQRRAALFAEILALGAQAWMTGTGEELFDELGEKAQRLEVREAQGQSLVEMRD
ncbi:DNA replication and repair protein RecF [Meinhardsimonia xiamenensis]|uniref:DNA replication and repair protein RecF n=1 Tax=Meinhardsimonia xiamenensis TaxID=990712 RepID=A0A1G9EL72_9RHOB|nr:DNA replication/repair protein RecF [Meinhardsimonia xiamenensis]PRX33720.1 DNA replication and repair protein RecF [Meinhardsimonia xiamenensis]SDK76910.1 DNA replication and repair protein RecF [Meinhardsimonia xiamenensis]